MYVFSLQLDLSCKLSRAFDVHIRLESNGNPDQAVDRALHRRRRERERARETGLSVSGWHLALETRAGREERALKKEECQSALEA